MRRSYRPRLIVSLSALLTMSQALCLQGEDVKQSFPTMRMMKTTEGFHFGLFGEKPAKPAPTVFIFATGIDQMGSDPNRYYTQTGRELAKHGWLYVVLDPPCHGYDRKEGEPTELAGWAHRIKVGQDLIGPFATRCSAALNQLIAEGYTDPERVAASGTSRGGFCALHFAANDSRIRIATGVAPVTNPLALTEFAGVTTEQVQSLNFDSLSDRLAGRIVWMSIGNTDDRVNTDDCVSLARKLVLSTRRKHPDLQVIPVELIVGPSQGHRAVDHAYQLETQFLLKHIQKN